jgi:hypothetical protein
MPLNVLFWVIYILALFFAWWTSYEGNVLYIRRAGGLTVVWLLIGILGYRVFGPAIR